MKEKKKGDKQKKIFSLIITIGPLTLISLTVFMVGVVFGWF